LFQREKQGPQQISGTSEKTTRNLTSFFQGLAGLCNHHYLKMKNWIAEIIKGFKNLWYWLPVIWKDNQWDYSFLYRILHHKLRAMHRFYDSDKPVTVVHNDVIEKIKECADRAYRLKEGRYLTEELEGHREKWGDCELIFEPYDGEWFELIGMKYENANGPDENEVAQKEFELASNRSTSREDNDRLKLFNTMRDNINDWWD